MPMVEYQGLRLLIDYNILTMKVLFMSRKWSREKDYFITMNAAS